MYFILEHPGTKQSVELIKVLTRQLEESYNVVVDSYVSTRNFDTIIVYTSDFEKEMSFNINSPDILGLIDLFVKMEINEQ